MITAHRLSRIVEEIPIQLYESAMTGIRHIFQPGLPVQRRLKPSLNTALAQPRYRSMIDPNALSGLFILQSRPQFPLIREQQDWRVSATVGRHFAFANPIR